MLDQSLVLTSTSATQNIIDPRRIGQQNSGFTDEDIADIICILFPYSKNARGEAARLAREGSPYVIGHEDAQNVDVDYTYEDYAGNFGLSAADPGSGPAFVLRLSALVKDPLQGFTFGRNPNRCDVCFINDRLRRLSNIHFRIFINEHGVLMLEDQSTNGTVVDDVLLRKRRPGYGLSSKRTLNSGTKISVLLQDDACDLVFLVRVPRREGQYDMAYQRNLNAYLRHLAGLTKAKNTVTQEAIGANTDGIVNLFPAPPVTGGNRRQTPTRFEDPPTESLPRDWNGSNKYNRVGQIGKGAFATVIKVTSKFDGQPYAAKELEKRRFIKNCVLDQKIENEMNIMQNVQHVSAPGCLCFAFFAFHFCFPVPFLTCPQPNIVRYIEHIDFEDRLFIIIMEYVPLGDLGSFVTKRSCLSEDTVKEMASQLINALGYLHGKNITHRDVKPDNILISSLAPFTVKLTDFGLSKMVDNEDTFLRTFCGTLLYCAPEVYGEYSQYDEHGIRSYRPKGKARMPRQRYDHAVDIWSLGGVLFYCLTGRPPFPVQTGTSYTELLNMIMTQPLNVDPLREVGVSPLCVEFLSLMLKNRPENRATVEALTKHPWLAGTEASYAEDLEQGASQLSIKDDGQYADTHLDGLQSDDEILDDEFMGNESQFHKIMSGYDDPSSQNSSFFGDGARPRQSSGTVRAAHTQQRLFGEINVSAIGSSGVIPEERLNLPLSDLESNAVQHRQFLSASQDGSASDETFLSPRGQQLRQELLHQQKGQEWSQPRSPPRADPSNSNVEGNIHVPAPLSQSHNFRDSHSVDELNNLTFDVESQSLGGAESIMENLNMKSLAASNFKISVNDFASSKRKPAPDTSDEFDSLRVSDKPTIKRLKSEVHIGRVASDSLLASDVAASDAEDDAIKAGKAYEAVQPVDYSNPRRRIDLPVLKSVFWTAGDPSSWHLNYPEMTQLQYEAFKVAETTIGEDFRPGPSLLWALAMKHFPPTPAVATDSESEPEPPSRSRSASHMSDTGVSGAGITNDGNGSQGQKENVNPRNASSPLAARGALTPLSDDLTPSPQPQHAPIVVPILSMEQCVARLESVPGSVVQNISVPITEAITSWGRHPENTLVFAHKMELKVPKFAFKILLWRSDDGSEFNLVPWNRYDSAGEIASRYHFYISTKARGGILVNGTPIRSSEPGIPQGPSRFWARIYDGDSIVVWHNMGDPKAATNITPLQTELVFRCSWGGSAKARPAPPNAAVPVVQLVNEQTGRRLDKFCSHAERFVTERALQVKRMAAAERDVEERKERIDQERLRSTDFEQKRAEFLRVVQMKRQQLQHRPHLPPSPVSAPPVLISVSNNGNSDGGGSSITPTPSGAASQRGRLLRE